MPRFEPVPTTKDFRPYRSKLFRIVEAQHRMSTDRLVDDLVEQDVLERLIEEAKPTMPPEARGLHHLLGTPFRYGYSKPTRFRRAHERPGIFYGSEAQRTAVAETAYWRLRFFAAAAGTKLPETTLEHWAFTVPVGVERALDLTESPLVAGTRSWTDPQDHGPCQQLAQQARKIGTQLIRYESVRDPPEGRNAALLDPAAFQKPVPASAGTWHFRFRGNKLTAFAAQPSAERHDFTFEQFGLAAP
ncbi:MAG TPA: RES family NAD+ phosphorylase [Sphingomicrobium sp.]|nr:RES family NAD+ phosphorylase [Sphingomicrobium sp.]